MKTNAVRIFTLIIVSFSFILLNGCTGDSISDSLVNLTGPGGATTLQRTVIPVSVPETSAVIKPYDISKFSKYGYGLWQYGPGLGYDKRLDLMPASYNGTSAANSATLLNFFVMTDIHITDEESPAQAIYFGVKEKGIISAYSPAMLYSTQMLDAAIRTVNVINKVSKFDFGISLGDVCNNAQYNELRWFIDVLDGNNINPDSGEKDDPVPGPNNDYQDEFKAEGLDRTIPWYSALGNHDHLWMGTNPSNDYIRQSCTGPDILQIGDIFTPGGFLRKDFYVGAVNGKTTYGEIVYAGPVASTTSRQIPADSKRRILSKSEWIQEFSNTSSSPAGHGFSQGSGPFGCYCFEPKSNIPIKVIVLDDTQDESDADVHGYGHGTLDQQRYDWLVSELDKGQSEGKLMIVAAHIPIGVKMEGILGAFIGWSSLAAVTEANLIAKLHTYPNLIMWAAGHRHLNTATPLLSPDAAHPELGFWVVETSSLREFPQQFRTFQIVRNSDNNISIFATNVDPAVKAGSLAEKSRSYAIAANQIFKMQNNLLPTGSVSYNAELVKQLTPEMQAKIKNLGTPINK